MPDPYHKDGGDYPPDHFSVVSSTKGIAVSGVGKTWAVTLVDGSVTEIDGSFFCNADASFTTNLSGKLYCFGGYPAISGPSASTNDLYVCDVTSGWSEITHSGGPCARYSAGLTYNYGKLYVLGGSDANDALLNDFWEYNIATNTWTKINGD